MFISRLLIIISLLHMSSVALAQTGESGAGAAQEEELGQARLLLQMGREDIIRDEIRFSGNEAVAFWKAYDAYHNDLLTVRNRQADIVTAYLVAHRDGIITDAQALRLIEDNLSIKRDLLQVQRKHLKQFRKILPAWKVARFYQLEEKLDAELDVELARFVPLMEPM